MIEIPASAAKTLESIPETKVAATIVCLKEGEDDYRFEWIVNQKIADPKKIFIHLYATMKYVVDQKEKKVNGKN